MTASVYDALDTKSTVGQSDVSFSVDAWVVVVKTERLFPSLQDQSFRIQMLYNNEEIDTKDWTITSDLKHSFEIHNGIISVVLDLDGVRVAAGQELFRVVMKPELTDTTLYPQFESIVRYGNNLTEELVAKREI